MHIATDGETYGHHHRHGEMALAYALDYIESKKLAQASPITASFWSTIRPRREVQIYENTAWSCVHGVERWRSNCGCNSGRLGWNQEWRKPLREALDWLRDAVNPYFETLGARYSKIPGRRAMPTSALSWIARREIRQRFGARAFPAAS